MWMGVPFREASFQTSDRLRLYRRIWGEAKKGVLLLLHGYGDHIGRYRHLVQALVQRGYQVQGFDARGHGQSDGIRGHIDAWQQYLDDLDRFYEIVRSETADAPTFLLGHSQGGHLALRYGLWRPQASLLGFAVFSPYLAAKVRVSPWLQFAAKLSSRTLPTFRSPLPFQEEELSHDSSLAEETRRDPLYGRSATARWYLETLQAQDDSFRHASHFRSPLLILQAGDDRVVEKDAAKRFYSLAGSQDKRWIEYPGYYHELHNETPDRRGPVFEDLLAWLDEHLPTSS